MNEYDLLFWGAGTDFKKFIKEAFLFPQIFNLQKVYVVDSDTQKWGLEISGLLIRSPQEAEGKKFDKIVVSSLGYFEEILDDIKKRKIEFSEIQNINEYKQQEIIKYQCNKVTVRNTKRGEKKSIFNKRKIVVYTAIIGDYDELTTPRVVDDGVEYVCFTDQKNVKSDIWNIEYLKADSICDSREEVRKIKALPHLFFDDFDSSIWIDANFKIKDSLVEMIHKYQKTADILLMPHNERICIYDEASVCIAKHISEKENLIKQIVHYYNDGYPYNNGLYCGGLIARNHNVPQVKKTMNDWFSDIKKYSKRDQVSLPYVIEKNDLQIDLSDINIDNNKFFVRVRHKYV